MLHVSNEYFCDQYEFFLAMHPEKREKWMHYFKRMSSREHHQVVSQKHQNFMKQLKIDANDMTSKTKIKIIIDDAEEAATSPYSIDFICNTAIYLINFMNFLFEEAFTRNIIAIVKSLDDLRTELKKQMIIEQRLVLLKDRWNHLTPTEGDNFLMFQMIPCILHFETRMGIKQISLVFQEGLSNSKKGILEVTDKIKSESSREKNFKDKVDHLLNNVILGNSINKYQFDLSLEGNPSGTGRRTGVLNFEDTKLKKKIMDNLDNILNFSFASNNARYELSEAALKRNRLIIMLKKACRLHF